MANTKILLLPYLSQRPRLLAMPFHNFSCISIADQIDLRWCNRDCRPRVRVKASPRRESRSSFHRRDLLSSHPTAISAPTVIDVTYNCR